MRAIFMAFGLCLILGCGSSAQNAGGNEGPGGGDVTAQQAAELANEILSTVRSTAKLFPEVNYVDLEKAVRRARILIKDRTFANDVETDAVNNGLDLIELNRGRWRTIIDKDRKRAILFHEILGLMGLEKNNYFISNRLLSVKNRFADLTTYTCVSGTRNCQVEMRYDRTAESFVVKDLGCGQFPNSPLTFFRRVSSTTYSTNGYCPESQAPSTLVAPGVEEDDKRSQVCSIRTGSGDSWDTIVFLDGYEFYFVGVEFGKIQLLCRP